ncbi:helix-turn-helix domain-containing protein [Sphaerisporangium viridialbum]|uniref:AraC-like ligand-binding domain-containing protein n=1 Tax=Sphaerisporangium viridialbum TaxID=46189 RepID=UPI003C73C2AE
MQVSELNIEALASGERFGYWQEAKPLFQAPVLVHSEKESGFRIRGRRVDMGRLQIYALAHGSFQVCRPPALIQRNDPEEFVVTLILVGDAALRQAGREAIFGTGEFALFDTSRPFDGWRRCAQENTSTLVVQIPRQALPILSDAADRITAVPFSARRGLGAVFARWLTDLVEKAEEFNSQDAPWLASLTTDLLTAVLARHLDSSSAQRPETQRDLLRLRIRDFIQQRLSDPRLSPATIASTHQISVRHLHDLFTENEMTVSAWIRHLRLERCRQDLADPRLRSYPVHAIARKWGFTSSAHFSRAFRATYGTPPSQYRHIHDRR